MNNMSEIKNTMNSILNLKNTDNKKSKMNDLKIMTSQLLSDSKKGLLVINDEIYSSNDKLENIINANIELERKLQIYKNSDKGSIGMFENSLELYHQKLILNFLLLSVIFVYFYFLYKNNMITFSSKLKEKVKGVGNEIKKQYGKGDSIIQRAKPNFF